MIIFEGNLKASLAVDNDIKELSEGKPGIYFDIVDQNNKAKVFIGLTDLKKLKDHLTGMIKYYEGKENSKSTA